MTAQLLCVLGLFVCGGDPVFQAGPPAQVQNTAQVSPIGQAGYPMVAWAARPLGRRHGGGARRICGGRPGRAPCRPRRR